MNASALEWELLTGRQVAHHLGVAPTSVLIWCIRAELPEPDVLQNGTPAWSLHTIRRWTAATGRFSPLRARVLSLLRSRGCRVSVDEVINHCLAQELVSPGRSHRAVMTALRDLIGEGFAVECGRNSGYLALPADEAETFDDRCLAAAHRLEVSGSFGSDEVMAEMRLTSDQQPRVAAALVRLRNAGLVADGESGGYRRVTPAGIAWLEAVDADCDLPGESAIG